jgi:sugar lactone lactonase YvrE
MKASRGARANGTPLAQPRAMRILEARSIVTVTALALIAGAAGCGDAARDEGAPSTTEPADPTGLPTRPPRGQAGAAGAAQAGSPGEASPEGAAGAPAEAVCAAANEVGTPPEPKPDQVVFLPDVTVATLAGGEAAGMRDGPIEAAIFANPVSVAVDAHGGLLVSDFDNNRIRRIDRASGMVSTVVSQGGFQRPFGLALTPDGACYAHTDYDPKGAKSSATGTIWRLDAASGAAVVVAADVGRPRGLAALPDGRLVLSDYQNARVRLLDPATGTLSDLAGQAGCPGFADGRGAAARLGKPYGAVVLPGGDLVIADYSNHVLRRVTATGDVSPYAGDGGSGTIDGPRATARFVGPQALAVDGAGNVYVSDSLAHRVRRVGAGGDVTTVAGDGVEGFRDGPGATSELFGQEGIAVSADGGQLFVADGSGGEDASYHRIRVITLPLP